MAESSVKIRIEPDEGLLARGVSRAIGKGIQGAAGDLRSFDRELERANKRVISFGASAGVIYGTIRAFKELVSTTIEVEKQLASINSIFGLTQRQLDSFSRTLFSISKETAQSFSTVAKAAEEFSRQGLGVEETAKRTRDALLLVRLTGLDVTKAVQGLTAAMATFGKTGADTTKIVNQLIAVDDAFAVSAGGIVEAFSRVGSVVDDAGVSLEQFVGLVTAARQITSRSEAVIGNSLKTIFTRLDRSSTLDQLEALGISVRDASGAAKNALGIFNSVANSYKNLNREQQNQVAELGAGIFQINQFKALLLDLGKANGIAASATAKFNNATDEALIRNAALNQTLAASIQNLKTSATEAAAVAGKLSIKPALERVVGTGNFVTSIFENIKATGDSKAGEDFGAYLGESVLKGLGNVLAGPGLLFAARLFGGLVKRVGSEVIGDIRQGSTFGRYNLGQPSRENETKNLQTVNTLLNQGTRAEQARFAAAKTVADQQAAILAILERQAILQAKLAGVPGPAAGRIGGGVRRAAGGYIPQAMSAERAAVSAGVGGATAGARAVLLPSFKFGGGSVGPLVANTSEYRVPNLAGGGEAIYNQSMIRKFGLPPGATPVAAGGYVPNAPVGYPYQQNDLRLQAGTVGNLGGGFFVQPDQISKLNEMFKNLSQAANLTASANLGPQITDFAKSLDKLSEKRVLKDLAITFNQLYQRTYQPIYGLQGGAAGSPANALAQQTISSGRDLSRSAGYYSVNRIDIANGLIDPATGLPTESEEKRIQKDIQKDKRIAQVQAELKNAEKRELARQRLIGRANNYQLGSIGLGIASGFVPEGEGGTRRGQALGGFSGALSGASFGGSLGSFAGPKGVLPGIALGALIGAISGFIGKSRKSFEELATQIEEANAKSGKALEGASQFINLQGNIKEAIDKGASSSVIDNLLRQQRSVVSTLPNNIVSQLFGAGNDETKQLEALQALSANREEVKSRGTLLSGFGALGTGKAKPEEITALGSLLRSRTKGQYSELTGFKELRRDAETEGAKLAEAGLLIGDPLDLVKNKVQKIAKDIIIGSNIPQADQQEIIEQIQGYKTSILADLLEAFENAQDNSALFDIADQASKQQGSLRNSLRDLIRNRTEGLELGGISSGLSNRIRGLRTGASLQLGDLTETAQQRAASGFNVESVRSEASLSNFQAFESLRTELLSVTKDLGSNRDTVEQIVKASSNIADLENVIKTSFKGDDIGSKLNDAVLELKKTVAQNDAQIVLAEEQARIDEVLLKSQQNQRLLSSGTFNRDTRSTASNLFSRISTSFGPARRAENVDLSNFLTQIGLPQTEAGLGFEQQARSASVRDNLSSLLSGRLGTRVGSSEQALRAATQQLGGQYGDEALSTRVNAGLDSLRFNPAAARRELLGGGGSQDTIKQLVERGEIGAGTLTLKKPLDTLVQIQEDAKKVLVEIAANRQQSADVDTAKELRLQLAGVAARRAAPNTSTDQQVSLMYEEETIKKTLDDVNQRLANPQGYIKSLTTATSTALKNGATEAAPEVGKIMMEAVTTAIDGVNSVPLDKFLGSFKVGFANGLEDAIKGPFNTIEQSMMTLIDVGERVGTSLESNLSSAFGDFIVGATKGKDAFRAFALGVLNDSARAFASKATQSLLGYAFNALLGSASTTGGAFGGPSTVSGFTGNYNANGGPIGFAGGGGVPVALTGGEFMFSPSATRRLGPSTLASINNGTYQRRAGGGSIIRGGSGVRDDVFGTAAPGSYVIRKAMVERYGGGFLSSMASAGSSGGATLALSTTPFADGGGVSMPAMPAVNVSGGGGTFNIGVTINDNSTSSTSSATAGGGGSGMDRQFGEILTQRIKQVAMQTIEENQRIGGVLRSTSRRT